MAKILSIVAPEGYQDREYEDSKKALEENGHTVLTASSVEEAKGKLGGKVKIDLLLKDAKAQDFDALAIIGGPGVYVYVENQDLISLAKDFFSANKPTCAICAAPLILAQAGLLEGKSATCWPGESETLKEKGAIYTGNPVEQDGLIITANGPESARAFGQKISENL